MEEQINMKTQNQLWKEISEKSQEMMSGGEGTDLGSKGPPRDIDMFSRAGKVTPGWGTTPLYWHWKG